ncbi:MAG: hypothetical protein AAF772_16965, partial [Acidobacteriota bacterium]
HKQQAANVTTDGNGKNQPGVGQTNSAQLIQREAQRATCFIQKLRGDHLLHTLWRGLDNVYFEIQLNELSFLSALKSWLHVIYDYWNPLTSEKFFNELQGHGQKEGEEERKAFEDAVWCELFLDNDNCRAARESADIYSSDFAAMFRTCPIISPFFSIEDLPKRQQRFIKRRAGNQKHKFTIDGTDVEINISSLGRYEDLDATIKSMIAVHQEDTSQDIVAQLRRDAETLPQPNRPPLSDILKYIPRTRWDRSPFNDPSATEDPAT